MKKHFLLIDKTNVRGNKIIEIFEDNEDVEVQTAAFFPLTGIKVSQSLIDWAGIIFVLNEKEDKLKTQLLQKYPFADEKKIIDLDIPSELSPSDERFRKIVGEKMICYAEQ